MAFKMPQNGLESSSGRDPSSPDGRLAPSISFPTGNNSSAESLTWRNGPTISMPASSSGRHPSSPDGPPAPSISFPTGNNSYTESLNNYDTEWLNNASTEYRTWGNGPTFSLPASSSGISFPTGNNSYTESLTWRNGPTISLPASSSGRHPSSPDGPPAPSFYHINSPNVYYQVINQTTTPLFVNSTGIEGRPRLDRSRATEIFLSITSQAGLAVVTILTSNSTSHSQSQTARVVFYFGAAFNAFGFLSCLFAMLMRDRNPRIERIATRTAFVCAAYGYVAIMATLLNDNIMLLITVLAFITFLPALASAFIA